MGRKKKEQTVETIIESDSYMEIRPSNGFYNRRAREAAHAAYENGDIEKADQLYSEVGDSGVCYSTREGRSIMDDIWNGRREF